MNQYDILVVGAGPAGLASAQKLSKSGLKALVIDAGHHIRARDRNSEAELTQGHGGAGLYSDGKFSFFPSASALWSLPNRQALVEAYEWTATILTDAGLDTPPFPLDSDADSTETGKWILKDYPSNYLSLEKRTQLIDRLVRSSDLEFQVKKRTLSYYYDAEGDDFDVRLCDDSGATESLRVKRLVIATGRFGPLDMGRHGNEVFRRLEIGFRIQQPAHKAFFRSMPQLDPKLKFCSEDGSVEWRTFCCCRDGATVLTKTLDFWTVSGHSDGQATGLSNIGFNTRIMDRQIARSVLEPVLAKFRNPDVHFSLPLHELIAGHGSATPIFTDIYGSDLAPRMLDGLRLLISRFPEIGDPETQLIGPTMEGVGWYPLLDGSLKLHDIPAWVVGDACGIFRGIVAAFISGHYAASAVLNNLGRA